MGQNAVLEKLLQEINVNCESKVVSTKLEEYSTSRNCFYDVLKKVTADGGSINYGWIIHNNEYFLEAERHAVWESPSGVLINISPNLGDEIQFYPQHLNYSGKFIPNVRLNKEDNGVVDDLIWLFGKRDLLYSTGTRVNESEVGFSDITVFIIEILEKHIQDYQEYLCKGGLQSYDCFCGSRKAYDKCHKVLIRKQINEIFAKYSQIVLNHSLDTLNLK